MNARAYYNENDPFAVAHLRELMADGLICDGDVDERSIEDVRPSDLAGYSQHHFFAGIGIWSLALRQAGWSDDRPVWTGSCPCQPFSAAGKAGGFADERHLWPAFFHLIGECHPAIVVGEQVASKDGLAWLNLVSADMEAARYAFGAVDTCAAGFGAPHIRQRLYFGAKRMDDAAGARHVAARIGTESETRDEARLRGLERGCSADGLEHAALDGRVERRAEPGERSALPGCSDVRLADADDARSQGRSERRHGAGERIARSSGLEREEPRRPGPVNGLWRNADWLFCRDGKWRPVEPGTFPLADAGTFRNRVAELRGAGNAINFAQATGFLEAFRESIDSHQSTEALDHV